MFFFDKNFDPLRELQNAANAAGQGIADIADQTGKNAAVLANRAGKAAGDLANMTVDAAKEARNTATDAAGATAELIAAAGASIADAAESVKGDLEKKATEKLEAEKAAYTTKVEAALSSTAEPTTREYISSFGDSPLPMTNENASRVKSSFPISREQTVVWADAEFDFRPSGIAFTEKGVYIKTDADVITLPNKEQSTSRLLYFKWAYFDPKIFAEKDASNPPMNVDTNCRERFIEGCKSLSAKSSKYNLEELSLALEEEAPVAEAETAAVAATAALNSPQEIFVEQRAAIHSPSGHGELAEEANNIFDKLQGHNTEILGRDNAKNGADRKVDGIFIQTKYHKTAKSSLESCFDPNTHQYRYYSENGHPMQLEVPKDQYQQALRDFGKKIEQGKVPGVNDPKEANNIVREGKLTYEQAVNLTKPGTLESVAYDAATGVVTCTFAFGLSFLAASYMSYRKTSDIGSAVQSGLAAGVQVFGLAFAQHMITSQLSRTGLPNILTKPSQAIVGKLGYKTSATIVNGLRALTGKTAISGAAATKQLAKMLRSNAATSAATLVVFSVPETYNLIQGKATGSQYMQNITSIAASVVGGLAGAAAAGAAAAKVAGTVGTTLAPGVGTAIGIAGGMIGGMASATVADAVGKVFYEGDGVSFGRYFNAIVSCMTVEHILDSSEMDKLIAMLDDVESTEFKTLLEKTLPAKNQEGIVRDFLTPKFEEIASQRKRFAAPTNDQIAGALKGFETELESE